jgi:hypothetical protein
MDKKITFLGGEPDINIDDLLRDPIANRAALFGVALGLGGTDNIILSGAEVTIDPGVDADVSAGYVWLGGEILQVDAATVLETQGSDLWEFQKVVTYDSAGDKTFNDATPRQTWQKNRAVLVNVATVTGMNALSAAKLDNLQSRVKTNENALAGIVNAGASITTITPVNPSETISAINYGRFSQSTTIVALQLSFTFSTSGVTDPEFTISAIGIPNAVLNSELIGWDSLANDFKFIEITGKTPFKFKVPGVFGSGSHTVKINAPIAR